MHINFSSKNLRGRGNFVDLSIDVRMELKLMEYGGSETFEGS